MNKLVSVIMPVYNAGELLNRSVSMLLRQTYANIEILLVDDGSTDDSLERARKIEETDRRVRVIHQENMGPAAARNTGMENARGEYYYFVDSDDEISEDTVLTLSSAIERDGVDLAVCGHSWVNKSGESFMTKTYEHKIFDGEYVRSHYDEFIVKTNPYAMFGALWNKLYKAEIIKKNNLGIPLVRKGEDEIFNMMYLSCIDSVSFVPEVLYKYYIQPTEINSQKYFEGYFEKIIELKNKQLEIAYNWNRKNTRVLEHICRTFAVYADVYIQMRYNGSRWYSFKERYGAVKETIEVFQRETPSKDISPDFLKYKYLLGGNSIRLFLIEYLKEIQLGFADRELR